jgi:hypothetical protein
MILCMFARLPTYTPQIALLVDLRHRRLVILFLLSLTSKTLSICYVFPDHLTVRGIWRIKVRLLRREDGGI